uniref:Late endosomal/lysosomal adaptor and MAPK and MTOR activator 5 n=1 Tax=Strongyloides papillosus TaxID=174720 RepID=A0A0N5BB02_STREA
MSNLLGEDVEEIFQKDENIQGILMSDKRGYPVYCKGTCNTKASGAISEIERMAQCLEESKVKHIKLENPISNFVITSDDSLTLAIHQKKK